MSLAAVDMATNNTNWQTEDRGDMEKYLAMLVLGLGSLFSGMLPAIISARNRLRFPLITSLLLCYGAGILLATALVHILPEVREQMNSKFAEVAMCGGFFIIYFIDEFIHYFFGEAIQHTHAPTSAAGSSNPNHAYGAIDERSPLIGADSMSTATHHHHNENGHDQINHHHNYAPVSGCDDASVEDANARICHTSHTEPCAQSMTGTLGLFVALSLHSAIEGLAIGVQNSASKVLFLLGAVACHKFVMGFCLGLELCSYPRANFRSHFIGILVFALGAVCGIGVGMLIVDIPAAWSKTTLPIIQALAGGTLFYVTVCEVIPREKARWHTNSTRRWAGFAQFATVTAGFATMCIINFYLADD
ncbi:zinc transporter ZIP1-like [Drosophila novamexicana]|uniref:zinc transporter ZIP1 n=1 Tax=Drosophila novamexicana TaxID=47314 RepID=UPI0011E5BB99|nr:zinc transporter ZIP1 [Drosophila novamexicana]XP_030565965.1 zinc transporter ZIP1-like [Drosophila novamexicana]